MAGGSTAQATAGTGHEESPLVQTGRPRVLGRSFLEAMVCQHSKDVRSS